MKTKFLTAMVCTIVLFSGQALAHKCEWKFNEPASWPGKKDSGYENVIHQQMQCIDTSNAEEYVLRDRTACNWFVGSILEKQFGIADFKKGDGYMLANEITSAIHSGRISGWKNLGPARDQDANDRAAQAANNGKAVIAGWNNPNGTTGHVALILPGDIVRSGARGVDVPKAAHVVLDSVDRSFVGCKASWAFGSDKWPNVYYYSK